MKSVELVNVIIGISSMFFGVIGGLVAGVWRLARIEGRLKLYIHNSIAAYENKFEERLDSAVNSFDETLKGIRQKVNDVEMDSLRQYVMKDDFNEFRAEYREDIRELKNNIDRLVKYNGKHPYSG
jgi:hypothetical protein